MSQDLKATQQEQHIKAKEKVCELCPPLISHQAFLYEYFKMAQKTEKNLKHIKKRVRLVLASKDDLNAQIFNITLLLIC